MDRRNTITRRETGSAREPESGEVQSDRRRRRSKGLTEERLYQGALYYLGRYVASTASVRRVLERRVLKYAAIDGVDIDTALGWIGPILERLTRSGIVDDAGFAAGRARSLFNRGLSVRMIRVKLIEKGLDSAVVDQTIEALLEDHRDPDLAAARRYVGRRRLGPYRAEVIREERRDRDLAALSRAGFSFEIARMVIDCETVGALEDLDHGR